MTRPLSKPEDNRVRRRRAAGAVVSLVVFGVLSAPVAATTIIVLVSDGQAWLAVDSLRTVKRGDTVRSTYTACKLVVTQKAAYAATGLTGDTGLTVLTVLTENARDDVELTLKASERSIASLIERIRPTLSASQTAGYVDNADKAITNVIGLGLAPGPAVRQLAFRLRQETVESFYPSPPPTQWRVWGRAAEQALKLVPTAGELTPRDVVEVLRGMMQRATEFDAATGGPVSIVRLTPTHGVEWAERGACR